MEWARSKARAERWTEEVALVWEEMRRAVAFTRHLAEVWRMRAHQRTTNVSDAVLEGLIAYAESQAAAEDNLAQQWEEKWAPV